MTNSNEGFACYRVPCLDPDCPTHALRVSPEWLREDERPLFEYACCHSKPLSQSECLELFSSLAAERRKVAELEAELRSIDDRFARRPALDDCKTRAEKVDRACSAAGRAETELAKLRQQLATSNN